MKINNKTKTILIIIPIIILITLMSIVWANNTTRTVTREKTSIILDQHQDDLKKVDVYLGMADTSSIASFQIGLNIDVSSDYDAKFEWSDALDDGTEEFKTANISQAKAPTTERDIERINIYYVGTKELNELTDKKDVDNIKIGTITLKGPSENDDTSLMIRPIGTDDNEDTDSDEEFSKTVSLSHVITPIIVENDDILKTDLVKGEQNPDEGDPNPENPDNPDEGDPTPDTPDNPGDENLTPDEPSEEKSEIEDKKTGIKVEASKDVLPEGTTLEVERLSKENVEDLFGSEVDRFVAYNINLKQDGKEVELKEKVKVKLPIPNGYDTTKLAVYRIGGGNKTKYDVTIETIGNEKYAVIETTELGVYALAEMKEDTENKDDPNVDNNETSNNVTDQGNSTENNNTENNNGTGNSGEESDDTGGSGSVDTPNSNVSDKGELDETPKTGTVEKVKSIIPLGLISAIGFIVLKVTK